MLGPSGLNIIRHKAVLFSPRSKGHHRRWALSLTAMPESPCVCRSRKVNGRRHLVCWPSRQFDNRRPIIRCRLMSQIMQRQARRSNGQRCNRTRRLAAICFIEGSGGKRNRRWRRTSRSHSRRSGSGTALGKSATAGVIVNWHRTSPLRTIIAACMRVAAAAYRNVDLVKKDAAASWCWCRSRRCCCCCMRRWLPQRLQLPKQAKSDAKWGGGWAALKCLCRSVRDEKRWRLKETTADQSGCRSRSIPGCGVDEIWHLRWIEFYDELTNGQRKQLGNVTSHGHKTLKY